MLEKIVIPALTFVEDGLLLEEANRTYIERLNASGIGNVIILGSTSQGVQISLHNKVELIRLYCKELADHIRLFVAPSVWSPDDFRMLMGLDTRLRDILFLPTAYFDRKAGELAKFMKGIFADKNKNIILYNLPKNTRVEFDPGTVRAFIQQGLPIGGIKLSHANIDSIPAYKEMGISVLYGSDATIAEAISAGADLVVCQNLAPAVGPKLSGNGLQETADRTRLLATKSDDKIEFYKRLVLNEDSLFDG